MYLLTYIINIYSDILNKYKYLSWLLISDVWMLLLCCVPVRYDVGADLFLEESD